MSDVTRLTSTRPLNFTHTKAVATKNGKGSSGNSRGRPRSKKAEKCPRCNMNVVMPCVLCAARNSTK